MVRNLSLVSCSLGQDSNLRLICKAGALIHKFRLKRAYCKKGLCNVDMLYVIKASWLFYRSEPLYINTTY
jgi:hypothetical protein